MAKFICGVTREDPVKVKTKVMVNLEREFGVKISVRSDLMLDSEPGVGSGSGFRLQSRLWLESWACICRPMVRVTPP